MSKNILILSAGRRVSLIEAFIKEASLLNDDIIIFAADANPALSSACHVAQPINIPRISDPSFVSELKRIVYSNNIKVVIPTIDTELKILATIKRELESDGIYILSPSAQFAGVCRNKRLTHQFFNSRNVATAEEMNRSAITYPLFAKPEDGSSSNNIYYAANASQLPPFVLEDPRFMFLEYLSPAEHDEFTVDMYYNREGKLCAIVPRLRIETRAGEVSKGVTCKTTWINQLKQSFNEIDSQGCVTMQFFIHKISGKITGIEINPRFGGGFPLSYFAGANFPKWIIEEYIFNKEIKWFEDWEDGLLMLRYDKEILVNDFKYQQ
jgi:carbamoyl-phosphate synthase large subunit